MVLLEDKIRVTLQHSTSQWFVWIAWHGHPRKLFYKCKVNIDTYKIYINVNINAYARK